MGSGVEIPPCFADACTIYSMFTFKTVGSAHEPTIKSFQSIIGSIEYSIYEGKKEVSDCT